MNKKLIGIAVAVVVLGGALFVMGGGGSKPEATFDLIKTAVEKKDVAEVEKYVDFLSLAESVISADAFVGKDRISMDDPFTAALINEEKANLSKKFRKFAADGNLKDGESAEQWYGGTRDDMRHYQNATGFRYWSYVSAGASKKDGDKTIVPVTVHDKQVDKDYVLDIVMAKEENVWRVKGINNMDALIETRQADVKAKIEEINKATLEKITQELEISNPKMEYFEKADWWSGNHNARIVITLKNNTNKTVSRIEGKAYLYKPGTEEIVQSFRTSKRVTIKPGSEHQLSYNGRIDDYENIKVNYIVENFNTFDQRYEITSVEFTDGTSLKPIRELPKPTE